MEYLKTGDVKREYGYDRQQLYQWEKMGALGQVARTPGGQRRYTREQIENLVKTDSWDPLTSSGQAVPTGKQNGQPTRQRPRSVMFAELGAPGLTRFGGSIQEERLTELQGHKGWRRYREMRCNDAVIAAVFFGLVNALKQPSVRVKPASDGEADVHCAEFVESCLADMSFTWNDTMDLVLNPVFEQGFAVPEIVYKRRLGPDGDSPSRHSDGLIGWRKWAPRPAESLADGNEWILDANGGVRGINQQFDYDVTPSEPVVPRAVPSLDRDEVQPTLVSIPVEKLLHFRTTLHPANNPEGMSLLRPMWQAYWMSQNMMEIEGIGVERDLGGIPVIYLGRGTTLGDDPNSDWTISKDIATNIRIDEQAGVVIPHPKLGTAGDGEGVLLELLSTGGRRQWDVSSIVDRYDKRKALSALAQFIMLGMQQVGSYALSSHQGDLFVLAAQAHLQAVAGVINRHGVRRLVELNPFPGLTGLPEVVFSPVGVPKLEELSEFVNKLVEREVLTPDPELERHMRQVAGLPQKPVQVLDETETETERVERDAERTALLLRRISLAVEPLEELGALGPGEGAQLMRPLVEELKSSLGADPTLPGITGEEFSERVESAKLRLKYDRQAGVPLEKAGRAYVDRLKKKSVLSEVEGSLDKADPGAPGRAIVDELESTALRLWLELEERLAGDEIPALAVQQWRQDLEAELTAAIEAAWYAGRRSLDEEPDERLEGGLVRAKVLVAVGWLSRFADEMTYQFSLLPDRVGILDKLKTFGGRMMMYPGEAWAAFNEGRVHGQDPSSLWEWAGPDDSRTCEDCRREVRAGPRPLSEITVLPGRDVRCRTNCRHILIRVK